jgi:hypothetical protein
MGLPVGALEIPTLDKGCICILELQCGEPQSWQPNPPKVEEGLAYLSHLSVLQPLEILDPPFPQRPRALPRPASGLTENSGD